MSKSKTPKTHQSGRNAGTGLFTSVEQARRHPSTHVVERVPNPGRGDTERSKKK